jgi:hypothetical protein
MARFSIIWRDAIVIGAIPCFNWRNTCNRAIKRERIMANRRVDDIAEDLAAVVDFVRLSANGARSGEIAESLRDIPQRTLQRWLKSLVESGRLVQVGKGPAARYRLPAIVEEQKETPERKRGPEEEKPEEVVTPLSAESAQIRAYLRQPFGARKAVGYNRQLLDGYRPNTNFYLSPNERTHLAEVGKTKTGVEAAGTYAKQILNRLLIDLSWNSSRLEGNTYSLLDTRRLIEFGEEAQGGNRLRPGALPDALKAGVQGSAKSIVAGDDIVAQQRHIDNAAVGPTLDKVQPVAVGRSRAFHITEMRIVAGSLPLSTALQAQHAWLFPSADCNPVLATYPDPLPYL